MQLLSLAIFSFLICLTAFASSGCGNKLSSVSPINNQTANAQTTSRRPDKQPVETEIRNIVAKVLNIEPNAVDVSAPLSKQKVAADELDIVEIVMMIEESLGVEIKDDEIINERGEISEDLSVMKLAEIVARKKTHK